MYIVAIGWLYVVVLMAFTEANVTTGVLTFVFYGLAPCSLLLWLFGGPMRSRARRMRAHAETEAESVPDNHMHQHDRANAQTDERKLGE